MTKPHLKIIPLGGLGEIGKNMMVMEFENDIIVIDAGVLFPEAEMLGVDLVIPDISYLLENRHKIRGIVITHGHEDHIGALPYVLSQLKVPVFTPRLAHGLITVKLREHGIRDARLKIVEPGKELALGKLRVEFFRVCHSIPDAMGLVIRTPLGVVVHTGDFKLDHTPVDGQAMDLARLATLGTEGVLLLFSDSTYVELEGYTPSEKVVGETLDRVLGEAPGRVIVATFASLISRAQQVINASVKHGRRVCIVGRSMVDTVHMASKLAYLSIPPGTLASLDQVRQLPPQQVTILATGTQGEPSSALVRVANGDHPQLRITPGDTVVMSASPIPGNEVSVTQTLDNLFRQGANVLYSRIAPVHVHGHAAQEELKLMFSLTRPRFFVPVHGEYHHLALHARLAQSMGIPPQNTFVLEDGDVLELTERGGKVAGKVPSGHIYVDGMGRLNVNSVVLRDRKAIAQDGIVVVAILVDKQTGRVVGEPNLASMGFVDTSGAGDLLARSREVLLKSLDHSRVRHLEASFVHSKVKEVLAAFLHRETRLRPMILPVTLEV